MEKPSNPFPWFEICTTDKEGAIEFYTKLFGWTTSGFDIGSYGTYTMFHTPGSEQPFGGIVHLDGEHADVPPHWAVYIDCSDVDAHCARVKELGGTVVAEPFDIPDVGRTALVKDPAGASFCLFKSAHCD